MLRRLISFLISAVLFVVGLSLALYFGRDCLQCYQSKEWKSAKGKIVYNSKDKVPLSRFVEKIPQLASRVPAEHLEHSIDQRIVRYVYKVDGELQTSEKVTFGRFGLLDCLPMNLDTEYEDKYPEGDYVDVTFDPNKPSFSVIDPGMRQEGLIAMGLGVFLSIVAGGSMLGSLRGRRR